MIPAELLKKIRRIQIRSAHVVNDVLAGQYHSAFKGRGMEFEEVRKYQVGDDVRAIDWNVSARTGEPFIKLFREERELTVMLVVDVSASHDFGTRVQHKRTLVAELSATLAFSAVQNGDKIGLILFADEVELYVPPRKGVRHALRIVRDLLFHQPRTPGTTIAAGIDLLNTVVRQRAVVFVISDFMNDGYETALRVARRRHDVIPVVVSDPGELHVPAMGLIEWLDPESGRTHLLDTSSRRVRRFMADRVATRSAARSALFRRLRLSTIDVSTDAPFVDALTRFFATRRRRH